MSGRAKSGAFIYAKNLQALADFYVQFLGLEIQHTHHELIILRADGLQLVIHQMPTEIAEETILTSPPEERDSAILLFFTIDDLEQAPVRAQALGGVVFPEIWQGPGFQVCNACDPEGNVFQIRQSEA